MQTQQFAEQTILARPAAAEKDVSEFDGMLELMQTLLSQPEDDDTALSPRLQRQVSRFLLRHGITVEQYQVDQEGQPDPQVWIVEPAMDVGPSRILAPALRRSGQVLRRGKLLIQRTASK